MGHMLRGHPILFDYEFSTHRPYLDDKHSHQFLVMDYDPGNFKEFSSYLHQQCEELR